MEARLRQVAVCIGQGCNLRCTMCPNLPRFERLRPKFMAIGQIVRVFEWAAQLGVPEVRPHAIGEPTIHPGFERIMAAAAAAGVGVRLDATNGSRLYAIDWRAWDNPRHAALVVSIDTGCEATYEALRGAGTWERLWHGMDLLGQHLADLPRLRLTVRAILMRRTATELEALAQRLEGRAHALQVVHLREMRGFDGQSLQGEPDAVRTISARLRGVCETVGLDYDPVIEHTLGVALGCRERTEGRVCVAPYQQLRVALTGDCAPCINLDGAGIYCGNVHGSTLREVWEGTGYRRLRYAYDHGQIPPVCADCVVRR